MKIYIRTPEVRGLGDLPSTKQTAKPYWPPLSNGGEYIRDKVAEKLLILLSGPSPYGDYIQPVIAVQMAPRLPKYLLSVRMSISGVIATD